MGDDIIGFFNLVLTSERVGPNKLVRGCIARYQWNGDA